MCKLTDDIPESNKQGPNIEKRISESYYYDDATGYETYDPAADTEDPDRTEMSDQDHPDPDRAPERGPPPC